MSYSFHSSLCQPLGPQSTMGLSLCSAGSLPHSQPWTVGIFTQVEVSHTPGSINLWVRGCSLVLTSSQRVFGSTFINYNLISCLFFPAHNSWSHLFSRTQPRFALASVSSEVDHAQIYLGIIFAAFITGVPSAVLHVVEYSQLPAVGQAVFSQLWQGGRSPDYMGYKCQGQPGLSGLNRHQFALMPPVPNELKQGGLGEREVVRVGRLGARISGFCPQLWEGSRVAAGGLGVWN